MKKFIFSLLLIGLIFAPWASKVLAQTAVVLTQSGSTYTATLDGATVNITPKPGQAPLVSSQKWAGGYFLNIQLQGLVPPNAITQPTFANGILTWKDSTGNTHNHYVTPDPNGISTQGVLEHSIVLPSNPASNTLTFSVSCSPQIQWCYQPALTADEIANGAVRPPNVVGSYALYIDKSNNQYQTGKLCHVYALTCTDSGGNISYAPLTYTSSVAGTGTLTATMDSSWLASATYPVTVDPTMGYTSSGVSYAVLYITVPYYYNYSDIWAASQYTAVAGDTISSFNVYADLATSGSQTCQVGAYTYSGGVPVTLTGSASTLTINSTSMAWYSATGLNISLATGTVYVVAVGDEASSSPVINIAYDVGSAGDCSKYQSSSPTPLPSTWSQTTTASYHLSIYATVITPLTGIAATTGQPATVGNPLTAGTVSPSGATVTYQWTRCITSGGTYSNISGATGSSYTPVTGDIGYFIEVVVTGTGYYSGTETSAATTSAVVAPTSTLFFGNG